MGEVKGYSTKYALTRGISDVVVAHYDESKERITYVYELLNGGCGVQLIVGKTFFVDRQDAEENAKEQAKKKMELLRRAIFALKTMAAYPKWEV